MLNFFKKFTSTSDSSSTSSLNAGTSIDTTSAEALIRDLKKQATKLKKTDYLAASNLLNEALVIAKNNDVFEPIETELRYASYLFEANKRDDAFNQISKLMHYGSSFDPPKPDSRHWFSEQATCLRLRRSLLAKEDKTESWTQYIFDSALGTHYEAMAYLKQIEEIKSQLGDFFDDRHIASSVRNLQFVLRLSEPEDINKYGWEGFIHLNLTNLQQEYMSVLMEYSNYSDTPRFNIIESWLESHLNYSASSGSLTNKAQPAR